MPKARFEVSTEGMRELQTGREPWQLAKELVANAWDESTTVCHVILKSTGSRKATLSVYDDGGGFSKLEDAWTLMGPTPKRGNPTVRGRFNIGEKEILSVAVSAVIKTSGKIVSFPKTGGRLIRNNPKPFAGTQIDCVLPWGPRQVENTINKLKTLLPPKGIRYTVNDETVPYTQPSQVIETTLDTTIQDRVNEPMRGTRRKTTLEIYPAGTGMLYEMGIPVQPIECPFLVNVMQKVPMPPNRDVVRDSYLQDIYATVLNATATEIEDVSATWVRAGIEDKDVEPDTVKTVMQRRYGDKVLLWSSDQQANERAEQAGYEIVHGRTLGQGERLAMESIGLQHTSDRFPSLFGEAETIPYQEWTEGMKAVADYAKRLARELIHRGISVSMYRMPKSDTAADWSFTNTLSFNVSRLGKGWFNKITPATTSLLLHEFAHTDGTGHNWEYQRRLQDLAGKAVHLALDKPEIFKGASK